MTIYVGVNINTQMIRVKVSTSVILALLFAWLVSSPPPLLVVSTPRRIPDPLRASVHILLWINYWVSPLLQLLLHRPAQSQYWPLISLTDENCCLAGLDAEVKGQIENQIGQIFPLMFLIKGKLTGTEVV